MLTNSRDREWQLQTSVDESSWRAPDSSIATLYHPFPTACLPSPAADFIKEGAAAIDVDEAMVALPFLAGSAACIGSARILRAKSTWSAAAILWTCVVVKSGSAKSPAARLTIDILKEICEKWNCEFPHRVNAGREPQKGGEADSLRERRLLTTNGTLGGIACLLQDNPKGIIYYADELAGWMRSLGRQSPNQSDESDAWNELYDGQSFWHDRKSAKSNRVRFANICITGSIQPSRLFRIFGQDHLDSGLAARILFARPPSRIRKLTDDDLSNHTRNRMLERLFELLKLRTDYESTTWTPLELTLEPKAYEQFREFHDEHQHNVAAAEGALNAAYAKLTGVALRLALVVQLLEDPTSLSVSLSTMERSIELTNWFIYEASRVYGDEFNGTGNTLRAKLLDVLELYPGSSIREMQTRKSNLRKPVSAAVIEAELRMMTLEGLVSSATQSTGGHPKQKWYLNNSTKP